MADARLLFPPGWQLTDSNDDPVSSGVIKFFDSGTSNARTVYSDSGLSTSLGTEISTNSAGRPASGGSEVLVYASEGNLKIQALTSASGAIWTFDDHLGALDTTTFSAEVATPDRPVLTKTGNYTAVDADRGSLINMNANPGVLTLPSAADVGDGWMIGVKNIHSTATDVSIATVSSQTIDGSETFNLQERYKQVDIVSDAANWHILAKNIATLLGGVSLQTITSTGTYTPSDLMVSVLVICTGGGGGGGGSDTDGTAGSAGGGGEAGGTCIKMWTAAEVGASATVTIGSGGSGGSAGSAGTDGGDTTVNPAGTGSTLTAAGGDGGSASTGSSDGNINNGGAGESGGTNGDINLSGGEGAWGVSFQEAEGNNPTVISGSGGASFWGAGGRGEVEQGGAGADEAGNASSNPGGGGGGAATRNSTTGAAGGAGSDGIAVFIEFLQT